MALLQAGDVVDVIAPGFAVDHKVIKQAAHELESLGLQARIPKNIIGRDFLCAQSDPERANQLRKALLSPDSRVIWCLRGGYGSIRLLDSLQSLPKPAHSKILIGLSDVCSLFNYVDRRWHWQSLHAPLLDRLATKRILPVHKKELMHCLFSEQSTFEHKGLKPLNLAASQRLKVSGHLRGGNLTVLTSTLGSRLPFAGKGSILFFEDLGERAYRIDRMLMQLRMAGVFKGTRAILFGDFTGGDDPDGKNRVNRVLQRFALESEFPVFKGLRTGHGVVQRPLLYAGKAQLVCGQSGSLEQNIKFNNRV